MRRVNGWTEAELRTREQVFDGLITKAVKLTLRPIALQLNQIIVAAPTISNTEASLQPVIVATSSGALTAHWDGYVDDELFPYLTQTFLDSAANVLAGMEMTLDVSIPKITDGYAQQYLATASNRLKGIGDVVWSAIQGELQAGLDDGEDMRQLATRVRKVSGVLPGRATVIARTEVHAAAEQGSLAQVQLGGFTDAECSKVWLATDDVKTREAHRLADGQTVGLTQSFTVDNESLQFPGDPLGSADNVIQCRCSMAYEFADDAELDDADDDLLVADADFVETQHPRGNDGKFIKKGTAVANFDFDYVSELYNPDFNQWFKSHFGYGEADAQKLSEWVKLSESEKNLIATKADDLATGTGLHGPMNVVADLKEMEEANASFNPPSPSTPDFVHALVDNDALAKASQPKQKKIIAQPLKINTNVIYKTEYGDGAVVAEKPGNNPPLRLIWDGKKKKFKLQEQVDLGDNHLAWQTYQAGQGAFFGKGAAYQEFKDQAGWTTPAMAQQVIADKIAAKHDPAKIDVKTVAELSPIDPLELHEQNINDISNFFSKLTPSQYASYTQEQKAAIKTVAGNASDSGDDYMISKLAGVLAAQKTPGGQASLLYLSGTGSPLDHTDITLLDSSQFNTWFQANFADLDDQGVATWNKLTPLEKTALEEKAKIAHAKGFPNPKGMIDIGYKDLYANDANDVDVDYPDFENMNVLEVNDWFSDLKPEDYEKFQDWEKEGLWDEAKEADETFSNAIPLKKLQAVTGQYVYGGPKTTLPNFDEMSVFDTTQWFKKLTQNDYDKFTSDEVISAIDQAAKMNSLGFPESFQKISLLSSNAKPLDTSKAFDNSIELDIKPSKSIEKMNADEFKAFVMGLPPLDDPSDTYWDTAEKLGITPWAEFHAMQHSPYHVQGSNVDTVTIKGTEIPVVQIPDKLELAGLSPAEVAQAAHTFVIAKIKPVESIGEPDTDVGVYAALTTSSALKMQDDMLKTSGKKWTSGEINAVQQYTNKIGYQTSNAVLRNDQERMKMFSSQQLADGVQRAVELQSAMTPLTKSVVLHRGTGAQAFGFKTMNVSTDELKKLEGKTIQDRGFTSTSVVAPKNIGFDYASKPIKVIVKAPKGTPGVYVTSAYPGWSTENEFILASGTNFHIDEVRGATSEDKSKYGDKIQQVVVVTVVPHKGTPTDQLLKPGDQVTTPAGPKVTPAPTPPTPSIKIKPAGALTPIKLNTKTIYSTSYAPNTIVAVRNAPLTPGGSPVLQRLVWDSNKKFQLQIPNPNGAGWLTQQTLGKKGAYDAFKDDTNWSGPPVGQNVASTQPDDIAAHFNLPPVVAPSSPTTTTSQVKTPPLTAAEIIKQHGTPLALGVNGEESFWKKFKTTSGHGTMMLGKNSDVIFKGLASAVAQWNATSSTKINHLQALKLIDQLSANKSGVFNTNAYENKVVTWLKTNAGKTHAPGIIAAAEQDALTAKNAPSVTSSVQKPASLANPYDIGTPNAGATSFPNMAVAQAAAMHNSMRKQYPLTNVQIDAIKGYTGANSTVINNVGRNPKGNHSKFARDAAANIQAAMAPLPTSITVHRGTADLHGALPSNESFAQVQALIGKTFSDGGFFSTSVGNKAAFSDRKFQLQIEVPAGTPAVYARPISTHKSENELILAAGLHYEVIGVTPAKPGQHGVKYNVRVRVVSPK